jgi:hypothetical protein
LPSRFFPLSLLFPLLLFLPLFLPQNRASRQLHIPGHAENIGRGAFGIAPPVAFRLPRLMLWSASGNRFQNNLPLELSIGMQK